MGLIKQNNKNHFLTKYGYDYKNRTVTGLKTPVYQNTYAHDNGLEYLWVDISLSTRTIYLYNEYECGGELWRREEIIPDYIDIENEHEFIDWLDELIDIE